MSLPRSDPSQDELPADTPAGYRALPRAVRELYSIEQWLWLSDAEKAGLLQQETEPEY